MRKFITKDSGRHSEYDSGMVRDTQDGKPRFNLMFPLGIPYDEQMLTRLAALLERGMAKYGLRNWEKANSEEELTRFKESAHRHFIQWLTDETDEDHAAAVMFNLIAAEFVSYKLANTPGNSSEESLDDLREQLMVTDGDHYPNGARSSWDGYYA